MLICHCNVITSRDIERVVRDFLREDPWDIIVPAKVYRELGKRGRCCGCFPNVVDLITRITSEYHLELAQAEEAGSPPPVAVPERRKHAGRVHERRTAGHRAA